MTKPSTGGSRRLKFSKTHNATPQSTPPANAGSRGESDAGDGQLIWRTLVPRLVHPARLQIVEALIAKGRAMSAGELAPSVPLVEGNTDLVRYHAKAMTAAGALEVVGTREAGPGGGPAEPAFYLALPGLGVPLEELAEAAEEGERG